MYKSHVHEVRVLRCRRTGCNYQVELQAFDLHVMGRPSIKLEMALLQAAGAATSSDMWSKAAEAQTPKFCHTFMSEGKRDAFTL